MDLIIVRHGRPVRHEVSEGTADPELSETGLIQAQRTCDLLAIEGADRLYASTMTRAIQTAGPLAEKLGLEVVIRDDLKESDHASQAYVPAEELSSEDQVVKDFAADPMSLFTEGYEPFRSRVATAFDEIIDANRSKRVVVFCHGMVTIVYLQHLLGFPDVFSIVPDYCGISRVTASSKGTRSVRSVNETGHLRDLLG